MNDSNSTRLNAPRRFGLRIENHLLQVAIATIGESGEFELEFDSVQCQSPAGWLRVENQPELQDALARLVEKHNMRRQYVAASLDGDFCVTRITTGTPSDVDNALETLGDRIPRYLQLGPGEKVTGSCRTRLESSVDYAMTGVANRTVIELLYDTFRKCELDLQWLEPSLVSLARLIGHSGVAGDEPVLIADGTGQQWDVGIAHDGRLLLDYRPAAASTEAGFRNALVGHMSRLRRFCQRHRRLTSAELNRLLICGAGEKPVSAQKVFGTSDDLSAEIIQIPSIPGLYRISDQDRRHDHAAVVATVLPLLIELPEESVPDLLDHVRRAPDLSPAARVFRLFWPGIAASLGLAILFGMVTHQRSESKSVIENRESIQREMRITQVRMTELSRKRSLVDQLTSIETSLAEPDWEQLFQWVTQSLVDEARLNSFRVEADGEILLDGFVTEETLVYDIVGTLRKLPGIGQVALKRTNPEGESLGVRFLIGLTMTVRPKPDNANDDWGPQS